jgi:hypothetical protein
MFYVNPFFPVFRRPPVCQGVQIGVFVFSFQMDDDGSQVVGGDGGFRVDTPMF